MHTNIHVHNTYISAYIHSYVCTYIYTCMHAYKPKKYICMFVHTYIHAYIHVHTYIHTYIHSRAGNWLILKSIITNFKSIDNQFKSVEVISPIKLINMGNSSHLMIKMLPVTSILYSCMLAKLCLLE